MTGPDQIDFTGLTNSQIIDLALEFEIQRYALQMEIGQREIGWAVDEACSRFFQIGKPLPEKQLLGQGRRPVIELSDEDLADFV